MGNLIFRIGVKRAKVAAMFIGNVSLKTGLHGRAGPHKQTSIQPSDRTSFGRYAPLVGINLNKLNIRQIIHQTSNFDSNITNTELMRRMDP